MPLSCVCLTVPLVFSLTGDGGVPPDRHPRGEASLHLGQRD